MADSIYRQLAFDVIKECNVKEVTPAYMLIDKAEVMTKLMMLPSAQPEITLESAIDYLRNIGWMQEHDRIMSTSVQPERKIGHWERHNTYYGDDISGSIDPDWRCSECGRQANVNAWYMYDLTDFCPHCGADMRGE